MKGIILARHGLLASLAYFATFQFLALGSFRLARGRGVAIRA